tara:strand:+ start:1181 stop:1363 length:183 start_codon:yes stop_codon:yes gene_type:complete
MGKVKSLEFENELRYPDLYNGIADEDFWIQCRKEELLEREGKPPITLIRKDKKCQKKRKK